LSSCKTLLTSILTPLCALPDRSGTGASIHGTGPWIKGGQRVKTAFYAKIPVAIRWNDSGIKKYYLFLR
ncbi:MAG: hypothetical protein SOZ39_04420, partial [Desulfovibrio piger]|uniref:hypothetical protein n=1 Tax=Desulfovibrio piger TaxID=901 RepID=UPI002A8283E7